MKPRRQRGFASLYVALTCLAIAWGVSAHADTAYPWLDAPPAGTIESRVPPPSGWKRLAVIPGSFAAWLRALPVKPGRPEVHLFNGKLKGNQEAQLVVLDVDTGRRDLQQCADAVMRLRAEFQRQAGRENEICFRFTDGSGKCPSRRAKPAALRTTYACDRRRGCAFGPGRRRTTRRVRTPV
jgi:hypothetical protein